MKEYSFSISRKVWFSLSILIIGYLATMIFGFIRGREAEVRLNRVSESLFPAALESKAALTRFNELVKLYNDAVVFGEEDFLEKARASASESRAALDRLAGLLEHDEPQQSSIRDLTHRLNPFIADADSLYTRMLEEIDNEALQEKAAEMNRRTILIRAEFTGLTQYFSGKLKSELVRVGNDNRNQRYGNMIVFIIVLTISFILVSIIINRAITRPLQEAAELAGAMAEGDLSRKLDIRQNDEIGGLARAMNVMAGEIETSHALLEQKVADRTVSLEESNKKLRDEITERKRTGEELKNARDKLVETARLADEANKSKSEFLARMSHEIRTPMNSIIGFSEMLLDTDLNEEQADYVDTITRSGDALIAIIDDILDFSKIEAGILTFNIVDFDPELTAFDVCEMILPRVGDRNVEIMCRIGDRVPAFVKHDPGRFRQVLINLMGNAAKFTETGEIELSMEVEEEEEHRLKLLCKIRDTGTGIASEKLDSIFEVFQQADGSITRKFGGTGLGLTICKQIANYMQGEVRVESEPGKGSTFYFNAWVEKSDRVPSHSPVKIELNGKRVLIVDDNLNNLGILEYILKDRGMSVVTRDSGEGVTGLLRENLEAQTPFDLCILDIMMPGISGYEVACQIRGLEPPLSNIPLLTLSSEMIRQAKVYREAGFNGFLPKPVSRSKLLKVVERLLLPEAGTGEEKDRTGDNETVAKRETKEMVTRYSVIEEAKHSVHILLAEDNPLNRKLAHFMLTKGGYRLDMVENGEEAVEKYLSAPEDYHLILMDIQMPVMDGREAARKIRRMGHDKIPIVAMTAETMKGDYEKCLEAGMNDYIPKPIRREYVLKTIKKWVLV
ncbi:MAG: response regulator [bacterium]|nr:response regulator [bacterium]